jgi:hypothetical protein
MISVEEASKVLDESEVGKEAHSTEDGLIVGLAILKKYGFSSLIGAEHDIIYVHEYPEAGMDLGDVLALNRCGFHIDPENDCWARFV